jgi:hypothetical protein
MIFLRESPAGEGRFISDATPFFQKFVDNPFYGQIKCVGLMVAEDLLGAN